VKKLLAVFLVGLIFLPGVAFGYDNANLRIWEFLPDPAGDEKTGEYVTLINNAEEDVNIAGYMLDDIADGGSKPYAFPNPTNIPAHGTFSITSAVSKVALNNSGGDSVRLLAPDGALIDEIRYEKTQEGLAYNHQITAPPVKPKSSTKSSSSKSRSNVPAKDYTIVDAKKLEHGTSVRLTGWVIVEPQEIFKQVFYLDDGTGGVEVYFGSKPVPQLAKGDKITVSGEMRHLKDKDRLGMEELEKLGENKEVAYSPLDLFADIKDEQKHRLWSIAEKVNGDLKNNKVAVRGLTIDFRDAQVTSLQDGDDLQADGLLDFTGSKWRLVPLSFSYLLQSPDAVKIREILAQKPASQKDDYSMAVGFAFVWALLVIGLFLYLGYGREER